MDEANLEDMRSIWSRKSIFFIIITLLIYQPALSQVNDFKFNSSIAVKQARLTLEQFAENTRALDLKDINFSKPYKVVGLNSIDCDGKKIKVVYIVFKYLRNNGFVSTLLSVNNDGYIERMMRVGGETNVQQTIEGIKNPNKNDFWNCGV